MPSSDSRRRTLPRTPERPAARRAFSPRRSAFSPRRGAFSLVELIVVMVIIGMLAGLVALRTRSYLISSKQNAVRADLSTISQALETFYADQGRYPTSDEGLRVLVDGTESMPDGLLTKVPTDPWKRPYEYISPGRDAPYEVMSLGEDGEEGGEGADRDFSTATLEGGDA